MNDYDYWQERAERRILNAEKTAKEMLKDLKVLYKGATNKIIKEIEAFYGKYAENEGLDITEINKLLSDEELKRFRIELKEYQEDLSKHAYDKNYAEELSNQMYKTTTKEGRKLYTLRKNVSRLEYLKAQMQYQVETLYAKQNEMFSKNMIRIYEQSYNESQFDIAKGVGFRIDFDKLNTPIINKAVEQKWLGENYSDRIWASKDKLLTTLNSTFLQDIAIGKSTKDIAKDIQAKTDTKFSDCVRLARTEFTHIANQASMQSYEDDNVKQYRYLATLDNRTSEICQELDGKIIKVSESEVGVNTPPMHPNCRSTTIPYFEDMNLSEMERIARDKYGKNYIVPASMTYKEWLKTQK